MRVHTQRMFFGFVMKSTSARIFTAQRMSQNGRKKKRRTPSGGNKEKSSFTFTLLSNRLRPLFLGEEGWVKISTLRKPYASFWKRHGGEAEQHVERALLPTKYERMFSGVKSNKKLLKTCVDAHSP